MENKLKKPEVEIRRWKTIRGDHPGRVLTGNAVLRDGLERLLDDFEKALPVGGGTVQNDVIAEQEFGQFAAFRGEQRPCGDVGGGTLSGPGILRGADGESVKVPVFGPPAGGAVG